MPSLFDAEVAGLQGGSPVHRRMGMLNAKRPQIVVPSAARGVAQLRVQAEAAREHRADLFELRLDALDAAIWSEAVRSVAEVGLPMLVTVRTAVEGGAFGAAVTHRADLSHDAELIDSADTTRGVELDARYGQALGEVLSVFESLPPELRRYVEALDVELARHGSAQLIAAAQDVGLAVVGSQHDFVATPPAEQLCESLVAMREAGADLAKIAVMPQAETDLDEVSKTAAWARVELGIPFVLIAMGELGLPTRIEAARVGSVLTFATAGGEASAPGQIDIEELRARWGLCLE